MCFHVNPVTRHNKYLMHLNVRLWQKKSELRRLMTEIGDCNTISRKKNPIALFRNGNSILKCSYVDTFIVEFAVKFV
jgi:hypothetical protein